jgi:hypothetical protein
VLASGSSLAAIKNLPSANLIPSFSSTLIFESPRLSRSLACSRQLVAGSIGPFVEVDSLRSSLTVPLPPVHFVPSLPRVLTRKIRRAHGLRHLPTDTGRHKIRCRVLSWLSSSLGHRSFPIPILTTTTTVQRCSIVLRLTWTFVSRTLDRAQFTTPSISSRRFPQSGTLVRRRIAPSSAPYFARLLLRCGF